MPQLSCVMVESCQNKSRFLEICKKKNLIKADIFILRIYTWTGIEALLFHNKFKIHTCFYAHQIRFFYLVFKALTWSNNNSKTRKPRITWQSKYFLHSFDVSLFFNKLCNFSVSQSTLYLLPFLVVLQWKHDRQGQAPLPHLKLKTILCWQMTTPRSLFSPRSVLLTHPQPPSPYIMRTLYTQTQTDTFRFLKTFITNLFVFHH